MVERILVLVAHPDDEALGCGGTIARHVRAGDEVWTVFVSDGESSREAATEAEIDRREEAARGAARHLGTQHLIFHRLRDNALDSIPRLDLNRLVDEHVREIRPDIVYSHHAGDVNIDHRRVHEAAVTACRPQRGHSVRSLLFFEVASSTEWQTPMSAPPFLPNWHVDITGTLQHKLKALEAYASEMRAPPHPRSYTGVEHLARWRGAIVGCEAAEAFVLGREVRRSAQTEGEIA